MKYYIWLDSAEKPVTKAFPYEDETERMVEESRPPRGGVILHAGTRLQLMYRYGLHDDDFVDTELPHNQ
jgi:hypothetical protein